MATTPKPTAIQQVQDLAATCARAADVARLLGVPGKSLRQSVRDARVPDPSATPNADGKVSALPRVMVSQDGTNALTEQHKRGLVLRYCDEARAQAIIDARDKGGAS